MGNVSERIAGGHGGRVPDFVTLSHWPTFNVADACVTVGVVVVIWALLFERLVPDGRGQPVTTGAGPGAGTVG